MTDSYSQKPSVFPKSWRLLKSATARFPALLVLGIVTALAYFCSGDWPDEYELFRERMARLAYAGVWGMLFSVIAQLLLERRHGRRVQLVAQAIIFALSIFALPLFFLPFDEERNSVLLIGVTLALCAIIMFILTRTQGSDIAFPNFIVSAAILGIFFLCLIVGLVLLLILDNIFVLIICLPFFVVAPTIFIAIFIALATREREQISQSFVYHFIVLGILLTNGILFFVLLYLHLFKCLFTHNMQVREIFLYVTFATSGYLFFYFASLPYESPFLVFFRRYGAFFMLPLLAMQIAAFVIKINADGYTPARVAALFYIIFSVASCALTLIKRGKYMPLTFLIFAALCILGSATPLNIIDLAGGW